MNNEQIWWQISWQPCIYQFIPIYKTICYEYNIDSSYTQMNNHNHNYIEQTWCIYHQPFVFLYIRVFITIGHENKMNINSNFHKCNSDLIFETKHDNTPRSTIYMQPVWLFIPLCKQAEFSHVEWRASNVSFFSKFHFIVCLHLFSVSFLWWRGPTESPIQEIFIQHSFEAHLCFIPKNFEWGKVKKLTVLFSLFDFHFSSKFLMFYSNFSIVWNRCTVSVVYSIFDFWK